MRKGIQTRQLILEHATNKASIVGLEGLSIGSLASELNLSKSGLFGHFRSKEELQIQVLRKASELFTQQVIRPALKLPRGKARLESIFDRWIQWAKSQNSQRRGCIFVASSMELDDQQGPVREALVELQQIWVNILNRTLVLGQEAGAFKPNLDPCLAAQEFYGIMLGFHFYYRLLKEQQAEARTRELFDNYLQRICFEE